MGNVPITAQEYFNSGKNNLTKSDYHHAISDFSRAIDLAPKEEFYYYNRGCVYIKIRNYDLAIIDFNKAIEINPSVPFPYRERASAKKQLQDYKIALIDYNKVIELSPTAKDYFERATIKKILNDNAGAISDFHKSRELGYSDSFDVLNQLLIEKIKEKPNEAISPIEKENNIRDKQTTNQSVSSWKRAKLGLIIFAVFHVVLESLISVNTGAVGAKVVINYLVSRWYIKKQINENNDISHPFIYSLFISSIVLGIRLLLGFMYYSLLQVS